MPFSHLTPDSLAYPFSLATVWNLGPWELAIIAIIILFLFGAKRLPEMGRSLGMGIKEFKKSITEATSDEDDDKPKVSKIEESNKEV